MSETVISIKDLSKSFGDHEVLRKIDIDVHSGEVICIVGSSGSGKSTLLAYMLSIYEPDITNAKEELAERSGQTADEITLSDDALVELRRAVLVEELDGLIFLNPDRYNENNPDIGWETADEYLSGNIKCQD